MRQVRKDVIAVRNGAKTTPSQKEFSEIIRLDSYHPLIPSLRSLPHLRNVEIKDLELTFDIYCSSPHQFDAYSSVLTLASHTKFGIRATSKVDTFRYAHFNLEIGHSYSEGISNFVDELGVAYGIHYAMETKPSTDDDTCMRNDFTFSGTPWRIFNAHRAMQKFLARSQADYALSEVDYLPSF